MTDEYQIPMDYEDDSNLEEETKSETKKSEVDKQGKIIDFFSSLPEEDSKRIREYLTENPKTDISVEDLTSLNKVLKQTNFQSKAQKESLSFDQKLENAKTFEEREALLISMDLYRNPSQGHSRITPTEPLPPEITEEDLENTLSKDEQWQEDKRFFEEKRKEMEEKSMPRPNIKFV